MICTDFSEPEIMTISIDKLPPVEKVTLLHVVTTRASEEEVQELVDTARTKLENMKDAFLTKKIPVTVQVPVGNAAEEIISLSRDVESSMIHTEINGEKGDVCKPSRQHNRARGTERTVSRARYCAGHTVAPIFLLFESPTFLVARNSIKRVDLAGNTSPIPHPVACRIVMSMSSQVGV